MNDQITQQEINSAAWAACDTFRGVVDPAQYKDYVLVMLFLKYISDMWADHYEEYKQLHAPRLQKEVAVKYGNKVVSFRTLLEIV